MCLGEKKRLALYNVHYLKNQTSLPVGIESTPRSLETPLDGLDLETRMTGFPERIQSPGHWLAFEWGCRTVVVKYTVHPPQ